MSRIMNKMIKTFTVILICVFSLQAAAQEASNCLESVLSYYRHEVFQTEHPQTNGSERQAILRNKMELTQGFSEKEIEGIVRKSETFDDGYLLDSIVKVNFPNGKTLYFDVFLDDVFFVNIVWLPDGSNLYAKTDLLKRPAIINDKDGFVHIRQKPDGDSMILDVIYNDELFFFTPESGKNWFRIYWKEGLQPCGYIHKSRITTFEDFPEDLKKKVRKRRNDCEGEEE